MKCKWAKLIFSHYIERGLDLKRSNILAAHLESCPMCRKEVDRLVTTIKIIREMEDVDPPRDYVEAVRACLRK